ncbi:glycosyltransferase family 2 protein [Pseudomonas donghuensis]|uniref:glycosyltransferase family 2 protein n=1 Tax=Pseudomonas donghuensis TaxID=1163398 RepID=UPI00029AC19A|nr:glycosyltransferase family 2 protein [Pseudomonas donghuensis]
MVEYSSDKKVAIILTVYNPDVVELVDNLRTYVDQVDVVVLSDNSDNVLAQAAVRKLVSVSPKIVLNQLFNNVGIAKAQNLGLRIALDLGCDFFIEMDQDSKLPPSYVARLLNCFDSLVEEGRLVGGVGPLAVKKGSDEIYDGLNRAKGVIEVDYTLSSGFLVSRHAMERIGEKNEDLFIDFVDWEWCWRSRALGYQIFIDTTLEIGHMLGDGHKLFFGFKIGMPSPIRHYYQYRNFIYLLSKSFVPGKWKIKYFLIMGSKLMIVPLILDRKMRRLQYIFKGIKDGMLKKTGKIS